MRLLRRRRGYSIIDFSQSAGVAQLARRTGVPVRTLVDLRDVVRLAFDAIVVASEAKQVVLRLLESPDAPGRDRAGPR
jgi:hypothetical protein